MAQEGAELSEALRQARLDAGLSQKKAVARMSAATRITRARLSQVERGRAKELKWDMIRELGSIYGVPPSWYDKFRGPVQISPLTPIPFFSSGRVAASLNKEGGFQVEEQVWWSRDPKVPESHRVFGVKAIGSCLAPRIEEGDILHIDLDATPKEGDVVFLDLDGEANVKSFKRRVSVRDGRELWVLTCNDGDMEIEPVQVRGVVLSTQKQIRK